MVSKRISSPEKKCCDVTRDIPDPIKKDLDKQGGMEGLLGKIPDPAALLESGRFHQALADPIRLTVMYALLSQPLCVCVIKAVVRIADSKLSYHLNILKEQDLIFGEQQGNWIIYSLTDCGRKALKCTKRLGK
jgi:ArsR family transcriptional regulator, arsenate/arsenite/antimonite-responsive transcriptional repressor